MRGTEVVRMMPYKDGGANHGHSCVKGRFAWGYTTHKDRITKPMIRAKITDPWQEVSWEEAINHAASEFKRLQAQYGRGAVGGITSSRCTNEETYLVQKMVRAAFGNNNVDTCARVCHSPTGYGLGTTLGTSAGTQTFDSVMEADVILIMGANPTDAHPVFGSRIKKRLREGARLIVIDPRRIDLVKDAHVEADYHLALKPGTNVAILNALAHVIATEGLINEAYVKERCEPADFELWRAFVSEQRNSPEATEAMTGVPAADVRAAARLYATGGNAAIYYGLGVTEHSQGSTAVIGIANLAMATGNIGRDGVGVNPLRGQNNVQGASDHGAMPDNLPGYQHVDDPQVQARFEAAWGVKTPTSKGLDNHQMVDAIQEGRLKSLYLFGEEMSLVDANTNYVQDAFSKLEFFVVQDIFFCETARFADVVLPAAPSQEKDGTFTSTERRVQRLYRVVDPLPGCRPDWEIVRDLANRLGADWRYDHPSEIMDEIAAVTPLFAGVSYDRLEGYRSLQWPVAADGEDQPLLYTKAFAFPDGKARLHPLSSTEPVDQPDDEYDLHLNNGRLLEHFHEGNLTYRVAGIRRDTPDVFVEVSPELARERGVQSGTRVELTSRYGRVRLRALVTDRVRGNQLYMPMNSTEEGVNRLTSSHTDAVTNTPAYKEAAVRMRVLPEVEESPMPRSNHRFGRPTPQAGVEVERKWNRPDYTVPGAPSARIGIGPNKNQE
jgi:formate dehydrogenase major subunit